MTVRTNLKPWVKCFWIIDDAALYPFTVSQIYAVNSVDLIIERMMRA